MTLVDTNVLIDVMLGEGPSYDWSARALAQAATRGPLAVNPLIYAELSAGLKTREAVEDALQDRFERLDLPWEAAFLAGQCFLRYRRQGGHKTSPLSDFYIGAHAAVSGLTLLTRDAKRYRSYFPKLALIHP